MNNFAQVHSSKAVSAVSAAWVLPGVLAMNTVALVALNQLGGIPSWLKGAVALFLSF